MPVHEQQEIGNSLCEPDIIDLQSTRRKQQSLEAEEAKQRLKEQSIFGEQEDDEDRQQPKKSESEVEEAAAIIAQRPENPREFFRQQERVASASSETLPPVNRTVQNNPWRKQKSLLGHQSGRELSGQSHSKLGLAPRRTWSSQRPRRSLCSPKPRLPKKSPCSQQPRCPCRAKVPWIWERPLGFLSHLLPPAENILDLWQNDSTVVEPTPPDAWELQGGPPTPAPWDLHDGPPAPASMLVEVAVPPGAPEPPSSAGLTEDNLLNFNDLPEPPATFCDAEQDEEPASIIAIEGLHQMTLSYQHALQEASGVPQEPQLLTNGETAQKESTQTSEGYFSQSQDEDFNQSEEPSAKAPPPVFYNKPPEIDITCWDADPVPEDEETFGGSV
ncbi:hypothetical protein lerEdw1_016145 [Lerista edwardsae]|nr:hypothetical protein lerEdw1_016145 [Lerista edwardsae]